MNHNEDLNDDQQLDALLRAQPVKPPADFLDNTMARILETGQDAPQAAPAPGRSRRNVVAFILPGLGLAAAAIILISFFLNTPGGTSPEARPTPRESAETGAVALSVPSDPAASETGLSPTETVSVDELLLMEESLHDLEFLLEEENLDVLLLLAETFPS